MFVDRSHASKTRYVESWFRSMGATWGALRITPLSKLWQSWASGEKDKDPTLGKIKSLGPVKTYYSTIMYHRTIVLGRNNLNNDDHQFTM